MKVLVLGHGSMGKRHAENASALGHAVTVYDPRYSAERDDEQRFWDDAPDAVVIASPASEHVRQLDVATRLGIPAYVEKPLTNAETSTASLFGALVTVGYNMRYLRGVDRMIDWLSSLGTPMHARFYVYCDRAKWPGQFYADTLSECSHEIDLAMHILGPATLVSAMCDETSHAWTVLLRHESGCQTTIHICDAWPEYERGGEIIGRDDILRWTWHGHTRDGALRMSLVRRGAESMWNCPVELSYKHALAAFLESAKGRRQPTYPACTLAEALDVADVVASAHAIASAAKAQQ